MNALAEKIEQLPEPLQREVEDFVDFIASRHGQKSQHRLTLSWAGGLSEFREQFTSLSLQKKSLDWWTG